MKKKKELLYIQIPDTEEKIFSEDGLSDLIKKVTERLRLKISRIPRKKYCEIFNENPNEDEDGGYIDEKKNGQKDIISC